MYKHEMKFVQQVQAKKIVETKSTSKLSKHLKAEARIVKQISRSALKSRRAKCPICKQQLPQVSMAIRKHYFEVHHQKLTEPEAYQIVSGPGLKKTPYLEEITKEPKIKKETKINIVKILNRIPVSMKEAQRLDALERKKNRSTSVRTVSGGLCGLGKRR